MGFFRHGVCVWIILHGTVCTQNYNFDGKVTRNQRTFAYIILDKSMYTVKLILDHFGWLWGPWFYGLGHWKLKNSCNSEIPVEKGWRRVNRQEFIAPNFFLQFFLVSPYMIFHPCCNAGSQAHCNLPCLRGFPVVSDVEVRCRSTAGLHF